MIPTILIMPILLATYLLINSIIDIKYLETPNYMNFGLIFLAFAVSIIKSIYLQSFNPLIASILGFCFILVLALPMFYFGLWGGGDVKVLLGIGAFLGLAVTEIQTFFNKSFISLFGLQTNLINLTRTFTILPVILKFLVFVLIASVIYGLLWAVMKTIKEKKKIIKLFKKQMRKNKHLKVLNEAFLLISILSIIGVLSHIFIYQNYILFISSLFFIFISLFVFLFQIFLIIEKKLMIINLKPTELTEGDWLFKKIELKGKQIIKINKTGLTKNQIKKLISLQKTKKIRFVEIKQGIPYFPVFFFGMLLYILFLVLI